MTIKEKTGTTFKKKLCKRCNENQLFYRNGLPISKFCSPCKKEVELEKKEKKKSTKTYQKSRYKTLKAKAWKLISEYVRKQGADFNGFVSCYTCGIQKHWKELHCSHYIHNKLDFDLRNLKPCCQKCNTYLSGNLGEYTLRLVRENGLEWVEQLKSDANLITYNNDHLETIIQVYKFRNGE